MRVSVDGNETNVAIEGKVTTEAKRAAGNCSLSKKFRFPIFFGSSVETA